MKGAPGNSRLKLRRGWLSSLMGTLILATAPCSLAAQPASNASDARMPEERVRRTVAGPGRRAPADGAPLPASLRAVRQAEWEIFGTRERGTPGDQAPLDGGPTRVVATGLPPSNPLPEVSARVPEGASSLLSLRRPSFPARIDSWVLRYLDFLHRDPRGRAACKTWFRVSGRYEGLVRGILREHALPEDLRWVAVVESRFDPAVRSPAGAAGLWQFMRHTGRAYGLVVDRWVDERMDPVRSTHAAAFMLEDLHARFGSWELALAAYNRGYGGVLAAVRKFNTNDYRVLSRYESGLPWETALYVPRIVSLAIMGKNPSTFGLDASDKARAEGFDVVRVAPNVPLSTVASAAGVESAVLERLNPQLLAGRTPPYAAPESRGWNVFVPAGAGRRVRNDLGVASRRDGPALHVVRPGQTVAEVARDLGVRRRDLAQLNRLRPDEALRPGTRLLIPRSKVARPGRGPSRLDVVLPSDVPLPAGHVRIFYRVADGDRLGAVAAGLDVGEDALRRWNALDMGARLHAGMTLMAVVRVGHRVELPVLEASEVRVIVTGTRAFDEHVRNPHRRVRSVIAVRPGDTWKSVAERMRMSMFHLARVNHRSPREPLRPGETLLAYAPSDSDFGVPADSTAVRVPRTSLDPPHEQDLPEVRATGN